MNAIQELIKNTLDRMADEDAKKRYHVGDESNSLSGSNPDYEKKNLHVVSAEIVRRIKGSTDSNENCCTVVENLIREANL